VSNPGSTVYLSKVDAGKGREKENDVQYLVVGLRTHACSVLCSCAKEVTTSRKDRTVRTIRTAVPNSSN
jgi:hypothetical protein